MTPVNLPAVLAGFDSNGAQWGYDGEDLNLTLVCWKEGDGAPEHVNATHDVAMVAVEGSGRVDVDAETHELQAGEVLVIPKGATRRVVASGGRFAYLNVHRRRVLQLQASPVNRG